MLQISITPQIELELALTSITVCFLWTVTQICEWIMII